MNTVSERQQSAAMKIEFSKQGYANLLEQMRKANYKFVRMSEALESSGKRAILRHDVDFSVEYAFEMAELENQKGVVATYFFMTTSEYYNVFSEKKRNLINKISNLGHEVGLHCDTRFLPKSKNDQEFFFASQLNLLSEVCGSKVRSASQHVPTDTPVVTPGNWIEFEAYSDEIGRQFEYVSDSSMTWRDKTPIDLINAGTSFQFLAHPVWWICDGYTQEDKFNHFQTDENKNLRKNVASYLLYMQRVLDKRDAFDAQFAHTRQRS